MDNSKMINKITKQEYPDIWESIVEDCYDNIKDKKMN
jgi:hypothetical protein